MKLRVLSLIAIGVSLVGNSTVLAAPDRSTSSNSPKTNNVKSTRPECIQKLSKAPTFNDYTPGEGGVSPNWTAYTEACGMVGTLETKDLEWLITKGTPAGRLYGAMLLKQTGRVGDADSFGKLEKDDAAVTVLCGCKGFPSRVSDIAKEFMAKGQFRNIKLSQFCKLKAPIKQE